MAAAIPLPPLSTLETRFGGPIYLGISFNSLLCGVVIAEGVRYWANFGRNDPILIRLLVTAILLLDALSFATATAIGWTSFVTNYGNWAYLLIPTSRAYLVYLIGNILTAAFVQYFLIFRCQKISQNWYVTGFLAFVTLLPTISGLVATYYTANPDGFTDSLMTVIRLWNLSTAIVDVLIALALLYFLLKIKSNIAPTNMIIRKLVLYALPSGACTAICALLSFSFFQAFPMTQFSWIVSFGIGRLYSITLLSNLNLRTQLKNKIESTYARSGGIRTIELSHIKPAQSVEVQVSRVTEEKIEQGLGEKSQPSYAYEDDMVIRH